MAPFLIKGARDFPLLDTVEIPVTIQFFNEHNLMLELTKVGDTQLKCSYYYYSFTDNSIPLGMLSL